LVGVAALLVLTHHRLQEWIKEKPAHKTKAQPAVTDTDIFIFPVSLNIVALVVKATFINYIVIFVYFLIWLCFFNRLF
jgi:hypothetical protein